MLTLHRIWSEWVEFCLPLFINHCWQSSLFFLLVLGVNYKLKQSPARVRYIIWFIASLKFIFPSILFMLLGQEIARVFFNIQSLFVSNLSYLPKESVLQLFIEPLPIIPNSSLLVKHNHEYYIITILWLVVSFMFLLIWCKNVFFSIKKFVGERVELNSREVVIFEQVKKEMFIKHKVQFVVSKHISEVGVLGIYNPIVVFPESLAKEMSDAELAAIFKHELIHVKRFDNLVTSLHRIICSLFWFNPIVWIIDRKLLIERELSCDEAVLEAGNLPKDYAAGLLKVLKFCLGWKNKNFSYAVNSNLQRRIEIIMSNSSQNINKKHKLLVSFIALALITTSVLVGILSQNVFAFANYNSMQNSSLEHSQKETVSQDTQSAKKEYELWKQNVLPTLGKKTSEQPHVYLSAKVQKLDAKTGEIKLAIAQQGVKFKLDIQPIEVVLGSSVPSKKAGQTATISVATSGKNQDPLQINYSEPTISFIAEENANAVEVVLYNLVTKATSTLILPFTTEPSTGLLTSIED